MKHLTPFSPTLRTLSLIILLGGLVPLGCGPGSSLSTTELTASVLSQPGVLSVDPVNTRYFRDANQEIVLLSGSHTWPVFQDIGFSSSPPRFDYVEFLQMMQAHGHNFLRGWRWEVTESSTFGRPTYSGPQPWRRSGPCCAADGGRRFDLEKLDQSYFDRLRRRVRLAKEAGIYVSVMMFEGWTTQTSGDWHVGHPFAAGNNTNGVRGNGVDIYTLGNRRINRLQKKYVEKVIDTLTDLGNVLWEISNENHAGSTAWQYEMIDFIRANDPNGHPVGMTFQYDTRNGYQAGTNQALFDSPADWISPGHNSYRNPPVADGAKVMLNDTDHLWGTGGSPDWVWKSFMRGYNPIFMDPWGAWWPPRSVDSEGIRRAMGQVVEWANAVDLRNMTPRTGGVCSTNHCLANPGQEYLVYAHGGAPIEVRLLAGDYSFEWYDIAKDRITNTGALHVSSATRRAFTPPSSWALLHIVSTEPSVPPPPPVLGTLVFGNGTDQLTRDLSAQGRWIHFRLTGNRLPTSGQRVFINGIGGETRIDKASTSQLLVMSHNVGEAANGVYELSVEVAGQRSNPVTLTLEGGAEVAVGDLVFGNGTPKLTRDLATQGSWIHFRLSGQDLPVDGAGVAVRGIAGETRFGSSSTSELLNISHQISGAQNGAYTLAVTVAGQSSNNVTLIVEGGTN